MTQVNHIEGGLHSTDDVWQLQDQLIGSDTATQKAVIQALLRIDSKEAIFILRCFLASKLYYGVPADDITDLIGHPGFEMGNRWVFSPGSWEFQIVVDSNERIVDVSGLDILKLPPKAPQFKRITKEDIEPPITDIVDASYKNNVDSVRKLIKEGIDVNMRIEGWTALGRAAKEGNLEIVKILVEAGASIEGKNKYSYVDGNTPLMIASESAHIDVVRFLLDNGANIDARNENGFSAFMNAAEGYSDKYVPVVKLLAERGANTKFKNKWGQTAFQRARNSEVRKYLSSLT